MGRKTGGLIVAMLGAMGFAAGVQAVMAVSLPEERVAEEVATESPTPKAGGSNRGYVVGKGGVARLSGSGAGTDGQGGAADIGVNEPGVNRQARDMPPRELQAPEPEPRGD